MSALFLCTLVKFEFIPIKATKSYIKPIKFPFKGVKSYIKHIKIPFKGIKYPIKSIKNTFKVEINPFKPAIIPIKYGKKATFDNKII